MHADPNNFVVTWASPTGHTYRKHRQQVMPPRMWVTTPGTAAAQTLDDRRDTNAIATLLTPRNRRTIPTTITGDNTSEQSQGGEAGNTNNTGTAGTGPDYQKFRALLDDSEIRDLLRTPALHYQADATAWNTHDADSDDIPSLRHDPPDPATDTDGDEPPPF